MSELATAYINLQPSFRGFKRALEDELGGLEQSTKKQGEKAAQSFAQKFEQVAGQSLQTFGQRSLIGAGVLTAALAGATKAAGNLQAALSANKQVLGDSSRVAQQWAKNSVEAVGLSERAALEATTSFGGLAKVMGKTGKDVASFAIEMTSAAADMAAFKDVPVSEALADLQSGFAGSTEVLRKYNIFLDDATLKQAYFRATGERVSGVLTSQQRVIATHAEITRQGADMWGQWSREADEFTGQQAKLVAELEDTAASIGQDLLPAGVKLLSWAGDAIGAFGDLNEATGGMAAYGAAGAAGLLGVAGAGALAIDAATKGAAAYKRLASAIKLASIPTGPLALGVAAATAVVGGLVWHSQRAKQRVNEASDALSRETEIAWRNADAMRAAGQEVDGLALANKSLVKALFASDDQIVKINDAMGALGLSADDNAELLVGASARSEDALRELAVQAGATASDAELLANVISQGYTNDAWSSHLMQTYEALGMTSAEAQRYTTKLADMHARMAEVVKVTDGANLNEVAKSHIRQAIGAGEYTEELVAQAEAQVGASREGERASEVLLELLRVTAEMTPEQRKAAGISDEFADSMSTLTAETLGVAGATKDVASQLPKTVHTVERAETAFERAAREAGYFSSALDGLVGSQVDVQAEQDRMLDTIAKLDEAIKGTSEATKRNGEALSQNTAKGRENRAAIRDTVEQTLRLGEAMLASGEDVGTTSQVMLAQRDTLIEQVMAFGLSEDAAKAYIDQLGLTPETIDTAITAHNKQALEAAQEALNRLEGIPDSVRSSIQAEINEGSYKNAQDRIAALIRARTIMLSFDGLPGGSMGGMGKQDGPSAYGNYFSEPGWTTIAEDGDHEVVLPLEKPVHLQRHLSNPNVLEPIMQALDSMGVASSGGGITINNNHAPFDLDRALAQAALLVS